MCVERSTEAQRQDRRKQERGHRDCCSEDDGPDPRSLQQTKGGGDVPSPKNEESKRHERDAGDARDQRHMPVEQPTQGTCDLIAAYLIRRSVAGRIGQTSRFLVNSRGCLGHMGIIPAPPDTGAAALTSSCPGVLPRNAMPSHAKP